MLQIAPEAAEFVIALPFKAFAQVLLRQLQRLPRQPVYRSQQARFQQEQDQAHADCYLQRHCDQINSLIGVDLRHDAAVVQLHADGANIVALLADDAGELEQMARHPIGPVGAQKKPAEGGVVDADAHHAFVAHKRLEQRATGFGRQIPQRFLHAQRQHVGDAGVIGVQVGFRFGQLAIKAEITVDAGGQQQAQQQGKDQGGAQRKIHSARSMRFEYAVSDPW